MVFVGRILRINKSRVG